MTILVMGFNSLRIMALRSFLGLVAIKLPNIDDKTTKYLLLPITINQWYEITVLISITWVPIKL